MCTADRWSESSMWMAGIVLLAFPILLAGCEETPSEPSRTDGTGPVNLSELSAHQELAFHLTKALGSDEVRQQVLNAMRQSLVAEHKLVLQDHLRSPEAQMLRDRMAASAEDAGSDLSRLLKAVPRLDFYVPREEDRKTWQGSGNVLVYSYLRSGETLHGFRVRDGERVEIGLDPQSTLVALHPVEEKHLRIDPQAQGPGDVIQDPDDGTFSGSVTLKLEGDTVYHSDLANVEASEFRSHVRSTLRKLDIDEDHIAPSGGADASAGLDPTLANACTGDDSNQILPTQCPGDGGGGGYSGVVLNSVAVTFCDNLNTFESNEVEFRSTAGGMDVTARVEDVPCNFPADWPSLASKPTNTVLMPVVGLTIQSSIYETDGWPNGDDFMGGFNPTVDPAADPYGGIQASEGDTNVQALMGAFHPLLDVQFVPRPVEDGITGFVIYSVS